MFFLSLIGFLVLFALGGAFVFAGLCILWWSAANGDRDWSWALPSGFGAILIYLACVCAPFTLTMGITA